MKIYVNFLKPHSETHISLKTSIPHKSFRISYIMPRVLRILTHYSFK